jgi:hypothetical protein
VFLEVLVASIIALMMEAARTSETSVTCTRQHGVTTHKDSHLDDSDFAKFIKIIASCLWNSL